MTRVDSHIASLRAVLSEYTSSTFPSRISASSEVRGEESENPSYGTTSDQPTPAALTVAANAMTAVQPDSSLLPPLCPSPLSSTGPTLSLASSTDDDGVCGNMVTVHHPPIEEEEREGETTTTIARLSFSGEQTTSDGAESTS